MKSKRIFKETEIGKIPEEWEVRKLGIKCRIKNGKTNSQDAVDDGVYPLFDRSSQIKKSNKFLFDCEAIIVPGEGKDFIPRYFKGKFDLHQRAYAIWQKDKDVDLKFVYYWILNNKDYFARIAVGSTVKSLRMNHFEDFPLAVPRNLEEQFYITKILSDLDLEIETNRKMNKTLDTIGQALFKHWFVDYEFPNENGKPYKSSGGVMVDSEIGEIPKGWHKGVLGNIIENYDSKRIPLSSRERAKRQGIYPYYGATRIMDYVDDYIFDGEYILMGEDGTVIDERGYPILQYVWGKFWVNNHTHVLRGKEEISLEYLFLLLKNTNVAHVVTGAVQPKINQSNMNGIEIVIPDKTLISRFTDIVSPLFELHRKNAEKIKLLSQIRDSFLPRLMSGKIRVPLGVKHNA